MIALGVRFDDRVTGRLAAFAPHAKVIHVDIDPAEIGKNRAADLPIVGDVKRVLKRLTAGARRDRGELEAQERSARARPGGRRSRSGSASIRSSPRCPPTRSSRST